MKKKTLLLLTVIMLGLFCLTSCQSKEERTISKLQQLSEQIEEDGANYDVEDWNGIMKKMESISEDIEDCDLTSQQMREVGRLQAKFYKAIMKNGSSLFSGALSSFGSYAKGFKEGILGGDFDENDLKEQFSELENAFKEAMESFEEGINDFGEELDNFSDELDEIDGVEEDFPEESNDLDD